MILKYCMIVCVFICMNSEQNKTWYLGFTNIHFFENNFSDRRSQAGDSSLN